MPKWNVSCVILGCNLWRVCKTAGIPAWANQDHVITTLIWFFIELYCHSSNLGLISYLCWLYKFTDINLYASTSSVIIQQRFAFQKWLNRHVAEPLNISNASRFWYFLMVESFSNNLSKRCRMPCTLLSSRISSSVISKAGS